MRTAVQLLPRCCIPESHSCPLPACRSRVRSSSSGSHLRSIESASTELLPRQRPPVISSHPGPCWDDEARVFRPSVDPPSISWLAAEACAVHNQRLSASFSRAAVELHVSSCSFPASPHARARPPPLRLVFKWHGEGPRGALLGNFCSPL